jgi:hypothetical protein
MLYHEIWQPWFCRSKLKVFAAKAKANLSEKRPLRTCFPLQRQFPSSREGRRGEEEDGAQ